MGFHKTLLLSFIHINFINVNRKKKEKSFSCSNPFLTPNFVRKTLKKGHTMSINDVFTFIPCTLLV